MQAIFLAMMLGSKVKKEGKMGKETFVGGGENLVNHGNSTPCCCRVESGFPIHEPREV